MSALAGVRQRVPARYQAAGVAGTCVASLVTLGVAVTAVLVTVTVTVAAVRLVWRQTPRGRLRREHTGKGWATLGDLAPFLRPRGGSSRLGRTAVGPSTPVRVRVKHEQSGGIVGGPRTGKSLALGGLARNHVGPAVISSRRFDLLLKTISARFHGKAPALVFAPVGVRGATGWLLRRLESAGWLRWICWDPVAGCQDPRTARERAATLVHATDSGSADDQTWLQSASTVLRCLLYAAALGKLSMGDVYRWVTSVKDMREAGTILAEKDPTAAAELVSEVLSANERGAASVLRAVRLAVEFMALPSAAAACCPRTGDPILDVTDLLEHDGTLYLVSSERALDGLTPLMSALTTHLWDTAVRAAEGCEAGKLPRTLGMYLDEVKTTARVPLDDWLAVAGGYGIHLWWAAQNFAQLREKWGKDSADAIVSTSSTLLVFGDMKQIDDLEALSKLCDGIITPGQIRGLPKFRALAVIGGCRRPTILATAPPRKAALAVAATARPLLKPSAWRSLSASPTDRLQLAQATRSAIEAAAPLPIPASPMNEEVAA